MIPKKKNRRNQDNYSYFFIEHFVQSLDLYDLTDSQNFKGSHLWLSDCVQDCITENVSNRSKLETFFISQEFL